MAKKKTASKKKITPNQKVGIGIGLTTAAVAAAGAYFLYGAKSASKNRKQVKSWMLKAKAEVLETIEGAKEMSKDEYETLIESVAGGYATLSSVSRNELADFKKDMKTHWKGIERSVKKPVAKTVKKTAKKVAKKVDKVVKKTTKKAIKKKK